MSTTLGSATVCRCTDSGQNPEETIHCLAFERTRDLRSVLKIFGLVP
jgi:hypothetical protein